jgi:hypothetical protein
MLKQMIGRARNAAFYQEKAVWSDLAEGMWWFRNCKGDQGKSGGLLLWPAMWTQQRANTPAQNNDLPDP